MKNILRSNWPAAFCLLAGLYFASNARAQLPNAWQLTDSTNAASTTFYYLTNLTTDLQSAATNAAGGFHYTVNARFVTDFGAGHTVNMIYGLGTNRFLVWWDLDVRGDLTAELEGAGVYTLTTNGAGNASYHTHEIVYNPTNGMASYLFDGQVIASNWTRSGNAWPAGQITWGTGSSPARGQMNFNSVHFEITGLGVVASYDAGTENNPTNAPDPVSRGWTLSVSSPPAGSSTNAISPDRGHGVVTTLADSGYGSLRQTIAEARSGDFIGFFTNGTITLVSGELLITKDLTIGGPDDAKLVIDGNQASRVLRLTNASVTLDSITITNGYVSDSYPDGGGGIRVDDGAALSISHCTLSGNSTEGYGGGIFAHSAEVTVFRCTFTGNSAGDGGGIENHSGVLMVNNSTFLQNTSANNGGGIDITFGTNTLHNCTFASNSAAGSGGGIENYFGVLTVTNGTFANNSADFGGGIHNNGGVLALANTIVAGNSAPAGANISGSFSSANNLTNGVPLLAPLGNYGSATQTMPPLAGSPAIDAGSDSVTNVVNTDQRGYPRLSGAHVDIGAVEAQLAPANNRPRLTNPKSQTGGALSFTFTNVPNADFTVLAATNVTLPLNQWTFLGLPTQGAPGQYQFTDSGATNYPKRFYQIVSP